MFSAPGGTRTLNLSVRSALLYPIELPGHLTLRLYHEGQVIPAGKISRIPSIISIAGKI